jgi:hypothetical protein
MLTGKEQVGMFSVGKKRQRREGKGRDWPKEILEES